MNKKKLGINIFALFLIIIGTFFIAKDYADESDKDEFHVHADFKVYLNGTQFNFTKERYMTSEDRMLSNYAHLHDMNGDVMHFHKEDLPLGFFFNTLDMRFNSTCFITDGNITYCNDEENTLLLFVNGKANNKYQNYVIEDLDSILITYGSKDDDRIKKELVSITDKACIQSEKCPEKGLPGNESGCSVSKGCIDEDPDHYDFE